MDIKEVIDNIFLKTYWNGSSIMHFVLKNTIFTQSNTYYTYDINS